MVVFAIILASVVAVSIFWISYQCNDAGDYTDVIIKAAVTLNVTPCYNIREYVIIIHESLASGAADYSCRETSYDCLLTTLIVKQTWYHIRDGLQTVNYAAGKSFWEGRFLPFFHILDWYGSGYSVDNTSCTMFGQNEISFDLPFAEASQSQNGLSKQERKIKRVKKSTGSDTKIISRFLIC